MLTIHDLLRGLAEKRPVFHSEKDFQFALAWHIREKVQEPVRLEWKPFPREQMYVDLWVPGLGVAIELKYSTRKLQYITPTAHRDLPCESFSLADGNAPNLGRYDFLKDVMRLERIVLDRPDAARAIAILLTNEPLYWKRSNKNTFDKAFHLYERRGLPRRPNQMRWKHKARPGKERQCPIVLTGSYPPLRWRDYGTVEEPANEDYRSFRYLTVEVSRHDTALSDVGPVENSPARGPSP